MKHILKILKLIAIFIITVTIVLFSASLLLQDKVADIILKSLNRNITTKLDVGTFKLSFLKKFPKASLELKDVLVHSSPDFISTSFTGINTDTLLAARSVSVEFSIIDVLKGNYNIERISVRTGKINFFTDKAGFVNYNISVKSETPSVNNITINLQRINLTNIKATYNNLSARLIINGQVKNGRIKSRISGSDIDFTSGSIIQIDSLQLYNYKFNRPLEANVDMILKSSKNGVVFKKGIIRIKDYNFGLEGSVSDKNFIDLNITSHNLDIADVRNYLPAKYFKSVSEYNPSGKINVNSKIKGFLSRTSNPHIEINCLLKDGHISYGKSDLSINDLSFAGSFSNGSGNRPETSILHIKDLKLKLGSAEYSGSFSLSRFTDPTVGAVLKGKIFPGELKEFFDIQDISEAGGSADITLKIDSRLSHKERYSLADLIDLKPEAEIGFNSLSIGLAGKGMLFEQVNGKLSVANSVTANNLRFIYKRQKINVDGEFQNLPEWLSGRPVLMSATANVHFSRLIPELFLNSAHSSDSTSGINTAFTLPDNMILDVSYKIDSLDYKTFSSSGITGNLNYKPKTLTFKSMIMRSLNGIISGNGFLIQNSNKSFIGKGSFNVKNVDVNKAFTAFHNFGQEFIKAENLSGALSGTLSLLLPMDSMLIPQIRSVTAEGKYIIVNGALIDFDPVKELSSYIELSELENISFEEMENDFFIRNNFLYLPQMDVKSSAANLSVNGKHSFDNDYEYHVKILLSEFLSKKRKKIRNNVSDFGVVEDDGLGRTSLLLKIEGRGEEVKVVYDIKAAGNELKNNIKSERQNLKGILNKEYGWFRNDTAAKQKPVEKKSRFRITFDETDSKKTTGVPAEAKKETPVKNIIKKK
jgi:hypothetical protein